MAIPRRFLLPRSIIRPPRPDRGCSRRSAAETLVCVVLLFPFRIVPGELAGVAYPPDVVTRTVIFFVSVVQLSARNLFADLDRFQHRSVAETAAANVVNLATARLLEELMEAIDQVSAVNVVAHLLTLVSEHSVRTPGHRAAHQVSQKAGQLSPAMVWTS